MGQIRLTMTELTIDANNVLDVREMPCSVKHPAILKKWFDLAVGDHFILVNTHDPLRLRDQFEAWFSQAVEWEYLRRDADQVQIQIKKIAAVAPLDLANPCTGENH